MKKTFFSSALLLLNLIAFSQPEEEHRQPPPISERWKRDSIKLQLYVNLSANQLQTIKAAFGTFYNETDALVKNHPDAPPSKEEMEAIRTKRSTALKAIFTAPQFDRFETFEKEFMPPPPHPPMHNDNTSKNL